MSGINGPLFTDPTHLANLKTAARDGSEDNLREVARQFESLFTNMLMKNMRAASLSSGVMDSDQSRFYQDMFDQQMSTELSSGQGLGIAELLIRQLGGGKDVAPASTFPLSRPDPSTAVAPANVTGIKSTDSLKSENAAIGFVKNALPHARRIGKALGVAPQFILAQAALESGWGQRPISNKDGSDSHNLFGIKAGTSWSGSRAVASTVEFVSGVGERVHAAFRSYQSMADSFDDYARLLQTSSRYQDALHTGDDGRAFAQALKQGGYATDPDYATKIMDIANGPTLENAITVAVQGSRE